MWSGRWGDDPLSSDHFPITINITGTVMRERNAPHENFNYDKADWSRFPSRAGGLCQSGDHGSLSIEALNMFIFWKIFPYCGLGPRYRPPKKGPTRTHNNPWWSDACGEGGQNKRYYYKKYRRNCNTVSS